MEGEASHLCARANRTVLVTRAEGACGVLKLNRSEITLSWIVPTNDCVIVCILDTREREFEFRTSASHAMREKSSLTTLMGYTQFSSMQRPDLVIQPTRTDEGFETLRKDRKKAAGSL
jgi:hypothetical protein